MFSLLGQYLLIQNASSMNFTLSRLCEHRESLDLQHIACIPCKNGWGAPFGTTCFHLVQEEETVQKPIERNRQLKYAFGLKGKPLGSQFMTSTLILVSLF
ncbi:hypothetical protein FGO68_gene3993 [Halteria grandinella]|uniref:Uncharacterized protein n=1 Tax=Halteria grandinella TaxID=5974 RepID=A0A8J8NRS7_HALGN|nr:hypothetical protein FGO68_gene3993 [Halteria grandinella]